MTNKIYDTFDHIKASPNLKASTIQYLKSERLKREQNSVKSRWKKTFVVAFAVFALLVYGGSYYMVRTPVSYISIDVNPSMELSLNRFDHVISTTAYNKDGKQILDSTDVTGMPFVDAIDTIVESEAAQPYLIDDYALTFTIASSNDHKESVLLEAVNACSGSSEHGGQSYCVDVSTVPEAHEYGLSFGKYCAILTLSQYDENISVQHCRNMPMSEIQSQIHTHQCDGIDSNDHSHTSGCQEGHNNCHNHH